jgi:hypothetical protein
MEKCGRKNKKIGTKSHATSEGFTLQQFQLVYPRHSFSAVSDAQLAVD